jgi:hypothetical protein
LLAAAARAQEPRAETTVGMTGRLEAVVLPGTELEAKRDTDHRAPVVVWITHVYPHGTEFRYDIEYYGLEPGVHDLRNYLQRKDRSSTADLPPLLVKVNPVLPPGQIEPHAPEVQPGPRLGGYRLLLIVLGSLWGLGFLAILASFFFPRRKRAVVVTDTPVSLADRLRPLVEGAAAGKLSHAELAGLERGLLAYWRRRLGLENVEPAAAMERLRDHPEAGPLLARLEDWLHRPEPSGPIDVPKLLAPYRNLPPDAADLSPVEPRKGVNR